MSRQQAERLAEERARLRSAGDYAAADAIRDRIHALGFDLVDTVSGWHVTEQRAAETQRLEPAGVPSVLGDPPEADWSVHWLPEEWPQDVERGITSFSRNAGGRVVQHVVVETESPFESPQDVEIVRLANDPGFARARNAGLRRSTGRLVMVVDGSVEITGDVFTPLEVALAESDVGIAGSFGLLTSDLREFRETDASDVDAIEGYLMAFPRVLLEEGLAFDPRFRFYRAADIDLSFQIKALGLRARRIELPVLRHVHRRWTATAARDRERWSKRNLYRFLDRFRGRTDLLSARDG